MSTKNTLFTVAGITTHRGADAKGTVSERTKVRYGTDMVRLIKMLNNPKKIEDQTLGICLAPVRVDFVDLPVPMLKDDAVKFLLTHPDFQSPADQMVISETIDHRAPKAPRVKKEKVVKAKKSEISLDSIKSRAKKQTSAADILDQIAAE
jgi:hypothetical protein